MNKLEEMLDKQTEEEYKSKVKSAVSTFAASYPYSSTYSILNFSITKHDIKEYLASDITKTITVSKLLAFISRRFWDKYKTNFEQRTKTALLRDIKSLSKIAMDYYE